MTFDFENATNKILFIFNKKFHFINILVSKLCMVMFNLNYVG